VRHLLPVAAVAAVAAALASCSPCRSTRRAADPVPPNITLADGGMGNACESTAQCAAGLTCLDGFAQTDSYAELATFKLCTVECNPTVCPAGFLCRQAAGGAGADGGRPSVCLPQCTTDSDCRNGQRAGSCAFETPDAGTNDGGLSVDGGVAIGTCQPLVCGGVNSGGSCPTGFLCQDDNYGGRNNGCYASNAGAAAPMAAPMAAWCGK
jgi:hypothetical protein